MPIEPLEPRIAPAGVYAWTDVDGDKVRITGTSQYAITDAHAQGLGIHVDTLSVASTGGNLFISVAKGPHGDGYVQIGTLEAVGQRFGKIVIQGDVGAIEAGDGLAGFAIRTLELQNLGPEGARQNDSIISGAIQTLRVHGDVRDIFMDVGGRGAVHNPSIGRIEVGGSISHWSLDTNQGVGQIIVAGSVTETALDAGKIRIGGSVSGGAITANTVAVAGNLTDSVYRADFLIIGGNMKGSTVADNFEEAHFVRIGGDVVESRVTTAQKLSVGGSWVDSVAAGAGTVHIHGAMEGGSIGQVGTFFDLNSDSGLRGPTTSLQTVAIDGPMSGGSAIVGQSIGRVSIGGDLLDGAILSDTRIGSVSVGGSVYGRIVAGDESLHLRGDIGAVFIGHDLGAAEAALPLAGSILVRDGAIGALIVGGDVVGGLAAHTGWVGADRGIGYLTVGGDVRGGVGAVAGTIQTGRGPIAHLFIGGNIVPSGSLGSGLVVSAGAPILS